MSLAETVEKLKKETIALRKETVILKILIKQQNDLIKGMLEEAPGAKIISKPFLKANKRYFPLMTQEELYNFEETFDPANLNQIVYEVRLCIKPKGLAKSLPKIVNEKLVFHYNLEGTFGKKRLMRYQHLMEVLYKAVKEDGLSHVQFIKEMRLALKLIKKRRFHSNYRAKRANQLCSDDENDDSDGINDDDEEFLDCSFN